MFTLVSNDSGLTVNPALIMIPDISGFTKFITSADLSHSQIKIAALLETILENNVLGLQVSEIEGDAILFYNFNNTSTADEIISQCRLMFTRFHVKLKEFETADCQCGSCQMLQELSLKFILHHGPLGSVMVKNYCKLYGKDLIIAHRLLKNNILIKEYILSTKSFAINHKPDEVEKQIDESDWKNGHQYIQDIGQIEYDYIDLKPMISKTMVSSI